MLSQAEYAIAQSVIYSALFDYPLTLDQLHESLIETLLTRDETLAIYEASTELPAIVDYRDGFFFPAGRRDLVDERRRREARSRQFLASHARLLRAICLLPFTRMVALSGSIAHLNLEADGDLDLFIVVRGRHVWTVTVAAIVLTKLVGARRIVCANFVLSDSRLDLDEQDLFTANQVLHLKPLAGEDLYEEFVGANPFVRRFYPNARRRRRDELVLKTSRVGRAIKRACEIVLALPAPAIEGICRRAYTWHLRRRAPGWKSPDQVRLRADYLKLHTQSHRRSVLYRFERAMRDALHRAADAVAPRAAGM